MHLPLILAVLQTVSAGASAPVDTAGGVPVRELEPDSAAMATAYQDAETRELVRLARTRRGALDESVFHYSAATRQRFSIGLRALRRDRLLFRRELAGTVEWWRDRPSRVTLEGARQAVPVAVDELRVPGDLQAAARDLVIEPGDDRLLINPLGDDFAWHPLVEGGEAVYRYAIGDTTLIRLPDGAELRLVELRVTPRERDIRLVTGSFWIELESHGLVQAVYRPSREFDLERDLPRIAPEDEEDLEDVPGLLKPIRFGLRYITLEYGLWEMRWWMPRLMAFEGWVQAGAVRAPFSMEWEYSDYTVEADRYGLPTLPPVVLHLAGDPYGEPRRHSYPIDVVIPEDTSSLLTSPALPESFFSEGEVTLSEAELRDLSERLAALPGPPAEASRPRIAAPWGFGRGLVRYNRVEGLSVGARVDWDLGRLRTDLTARIGAADLEPRAELGIDLPSEARTWRAAAYHRLASADPRLRPFGLGNSVTALVLGRDDGMYYGASGVELRVAPEPGAGGYQLRLYAERQSRVSRNTDVSVPHLLGGAGFRPNLAADEADQLGLHALIGGERGLDPTGWRWGAWLDITAETGDYTFVRPGLTLRSTAPLPGELLGALEVAGGTTLGRDTPGPRQALWLLGGPGTVRGLSGGALAGPDYARARAEVATGIPGIRLALFSDAGWAGRFEEALRREVAISAGAGFSVLDGLLRLDLARAFQPEPQWRLDLYLDALF